MNTPFTWIALLAIADVCLGFIAVPAAIYLRPTRSSPLRIGIAVGPTVLMLLLFYSLALHMHQSLGKWPESIGERGFPPMLVTHGSIAGTYFSMWLLIAIFVLPIAFVLCLAVRRWRGAAYYLAIYILSCIVGFGLLLLAPSPFLNWWWD